jgi:hypothetical protein
MIRVHVLPFVILTISLKLHKVMKFMRYLLSILTIILIQLFKAHGVPPVLNYAGQVAVNGETFEGNGLFKFALVSDNGTSTYWSNDGTSVDGSEPQSSISVSVNGGLYSVLLGNTAIQGMGAIDPQVFAQHTDAKLRVWFSDGVNGFQQLTPDRPFASVPYAFSAGNAETAGSASIDNGAVTKSMLSSEVINELGRKITMDDLDPTVIADLNDSLVDGSITTNKLNEQILKYLKPEITQQPTAGTIFADSNGTISVSAEGKYLSYQWKKDGVDLTGETNSTLTITDANATQHDGNYSLVVSNDFGSVESSELELLISNWNPSALDDMLLWLDANDISSILHDSNLVSEWKDKSGNGNNATQTVSANKPSTGTSEINGLNTLKFDGSTDFLNVTSFSGTPSIYLLISVNGTSGNRRILSQGGHLNANGLGFFLRVKNNNIESTFAGTTLNTPISSSTAYIISLDWSTKMWLNGTLVGSKNQEQLTSTNILNISSFGNGTGEFYDGNIGEIILIYSLSTSNERQVIEGYLAHKWGLSTILPSTHQYKNIAP